jgi:hypothetical protein
MCCRRQPPILDTLHSLSPVFRPSYVLSKSWFLGGCLCKIFGGSNVCKFWGGGEQYVLNNSGKDGFISFWWYTWRHLYLDLLFSVRYRSIEIMITWIYQQFIKKLAHWSSYFIQYTVKVYLFVWRCDKVMSL